MNFEGPAQRQSGKLSGETSNLKTYSVAPFLALSLLDELRVDHCSGKRCGAVCHHTLHVHLRLRGRNSEENSNHVALII